MDKSITAEQAFHPHVEFTFRVLLRHRRDEGCFPSVSRIANICRLSVRQIQRHLKTLEEAGRIRREARQRRNGSRSSNGFSFPSLFLGADVTPDVTPLTASQEDKNKAEKTTNAVESQPRPAERGPEAAKPGRLSLLTEKLQLLHTALPGGSRRSNTTATAKTASWAVHRASQAVGRKLTPDEVLAELTGQGFVNHMANLIRRRKAPMTLSGICEYLYNWLAPSDRQTENYNPAAYLPSPKEDRVLTAEWMEAA